MVEEGMAIEELAQIDERFEEYCEMTGWDFLTSWNAGSDDAKIPDEVIRKIHAVDAKYPYKLLNRLQNLWDAVYDPDDVLPTREKMRNIVEETLSS